MGEDGDIVNAAIQYFHKNFAAVADCRAREICIAGLTGSSAAFAATSLAGATSGASPHLVVASLGGNMIDVEAMVNDLQILSKETKCRVLEFPPLLKEEPQTIGMRLKTVAALRAWQAKPYPCVVVALREELDSLVNRETPKPIIVDSPGGISFKELSSSLAEYGYRRSNIVNREGDWSVRGGIIDVWAYGEEMPARFEFFGDDLESARYFDAVSQCSVERLVHIEICSLSTGEEGSKIPFCKILPEGSTLLAIGHNSQSPFSAETLERFSFAVYTGDPAPRAVPTARFQTSPLPGFMDLGADEAHHPELFEAARARLARHLQAARARGDIVLSVDELSGGFEIPGLIVVTKSDRVFVRRKARIRRKTKAEAVTGVRINDFDELEPGEYVVHADYGVGRFIGASEIIHSNGKHSEVFTIEYADGAKLHVPAFNAHLLSRYVGVKGESVHLHKLDGKRWKRDKVEAEKAIQDLASNLLETQAKRAIVPGFAYDIHPDGMEDFEAAFGYQETPDQIAAIEDVKKDLASTRPMDRLICGDAGYGKTEVAMRAAYIAAMNAKQVVVLAPTTVLAEQHFETFTSRFDGTPIRIESVSRFQSDTTHQGTFRRIASGACDIVIGTHALLTGKVEFHDLGLIIIDEEQRFGVRQKEMLKSLRATADIMAMSATPIPRTLYLSMTGARDLSILRTPPVERVAVETIVARDSDEVITAAIRQELERNGQIFFLHNRISTIYQIERRLHALFPKLRIVVAHGRMESGELARDMNSFARGKYDLCLSTTIVEAGIDIPRANTIIVNRADMFGLAELYQLRGRVGRSSRQGHAIFLLPFDGIIEAEARERLDALQRHSGLGAGFNLAMRDLEIRGAGNLLGAKQSGHIAAIGFGLYCQLLQRTIARLKGERIRDIVDVKINLDFVDLSPNDGESAASLPHSYIEDDVQRMTMMKRLAEVNSLKDAGSLAAEMKDRFGEPPQSVRRLLKIVKLRVNCAQRDIARIDARGNTAFIYKTGLDKVDRIVDIGDISPDRSLAILAAAVKKYPFAGK